MSPLYHHSERDVEIKRGEARKVVAAGLAKITKFRFIISL
jgi:hypothetical protein